MIHSKPVKPAKNPWREPPRLVRYLCAPFTWLRGKWWHYSRRIERAYSFAKLGWGNYDFDAGYLLELIIFKLERMHALFTGDNAMCRHENENIKALRTAIRLGGRLRKDDYRYAMQAHERKWGELKVEFEPLDPAETGYKGSAMHTWREKTKDAPEAVQEQEREEFMAAVNADDATRERDARWFFNIIAKYYPGWWD